MPPPKVMGVELPPAEATPRNELVLRKIREGEELRQTLSDHVQRLDDRVGALESKVSEIKTSNDASNRRTTIAVAGIGLLGVIATAALAYWGQIQSIKAGREQGQVAATQTVQSAQPSTEATYRAGFRDGARATIDEQLARLQSQPAPIARAPDSVTPRRR